MTLDPDQLDRLLRLADALERDRWAGGPALRGELPRVPTREALPTAAIEYAYQMVAIPGTPDVVYACLRNAGGAWGWRTVATG